MGPVDLVDPVDRMDPAYPVGPVAPVAPVGQPVRAGDRLTAAPCSAREALARSAGH